MNFVKKSKILGQHVHHGPHSSYSHSSPHGGGGGHHHHNHHDVQPHSGLHHHLQHHDNIDSIHDGGMDPHDVSTTSDLATSYYGYRYNQELLQK